MKQTTEHQRLAPGIREDWRRWGCYVSGRNWATAREYGDPSKNWEGFPFEYASHKAYRWSEDGIGGFSDDQQRICLAAAFWNERDPRLKERFFGLTNEQGNHGEDVKDYYFFVDAVPSFSYMKMLYKYPQIEYPYARLVVENAIADSSKPSVELVNVLEQTFKERCYFDIFIEFAKAGPNDLLYRITVVNRGSDPAPLHVLPHVWYRNTAKPGTRPPQLRADGDGVFVPHPELGDYHWHVEETEEFLFTDNASNTQWLNDVPNATLYTKDGIEAAVVRGKKECVNPDKVGTKAAAHCIRTVGPGETWVIRSRLTTSANSVPFADFDAIFVQCQQEADDFYAALQETVPTDEQKAIQRAAFVGLTWNQHFYNFNVKEWIADETQAPPDRDVEAFESWKHFDAHDILSVPEPWEYPLLAAWDTSFQIGTLGIVDPDFAKGQALLLLSDRYMRSDGAIPGFESDMNTPQPPVHAHAIWHVYQLWDRDHAFIEKAYPALKRHYDWWFREHQPKPYLFDGGFLGKDNISPVDRTNGIPEGGSIEQADSTGWMALFTLDLLALAIELNQDEDALMLLDHFFKLRDSIQTLWDKKERFFFDVVNLPDGTCLPIKVRSLAGIIPFIATLLLKPHELDKTPRLQAHLEALGADDKDFTINDEGYLLLSLLPHKQIQTLLPVLFDPAEFYSPYGLRSLSKYHEKHPVTVEMNGDKRELKYEPGESQDQSAGGNSNWRGPIWAPINDVVLEALTVYHTYFKKPLLKQGNKHITLDEAAQQLVQRLIAVFERNKKGERPYLSYNAVFKDDPLWFFEHFDGETGRGLGASHQNGWTAILGKLIHHQGRALYIPQNRSQD
jgi:hypothetical protein